MVDPRPEACRAGMVVAVMPRRATPFPGRTRVFCLSI
jgi:hypothetical protein